MLDHKNSIDKYASKYFHMTSQSLSGSKNTAVLKFFCFDNQVTVCGIHFIEKLIVRELEEKKLKNIKVYSLQDGQIINAYEPVLVIQGHYQDFALLEGIIDGFLTRLSSVATNVKKIMKLIGEKQLIFMADRNDLYFNQPYDGYAAYVGGIKKFVTKAMLEYINDQKAEYVGTIPHSLIQQHQGNLIGALETFHKSFPKQKITALIDYQNNCVGEIEKIAKHWIKEHIEAVRIDTSLSLVDHSLQIGDWQNNIDIKGVCHELVINVRKALDKNKLNNVKIIVSSSMNEAKIENFNKLKTPIDCYGIGSWFLNKSCHFTADLVKLNGAYEAKTGRKNFDDSQLKKLKLWDWSKIKENKC